MATQGYTSKTGRGQRVSRPLAGLAYWKQHGDEIRSLGAGRYEVPSRKYEGKRHQVNIEDETCTCEDATNRGRMCAHVFGVVIAMSKPAPILSRERFRFSSEQITQNLERMEA